MFSHVCLTERLKGMSHRAGRGFVINAPRIIDIMIYIYNCLSKQCYLYTVQETIKTQSEGEEMSQVNLCVFHGHGNIHGQLNPHCRF